MSMGDHSMKASFSWSISKVQLLGAIVGVAITTVSMVVCEIVFPHEISGVLSCVISASVSFVMIEMTVTHGLFDEKRLLVFASTIYGALLVPMFVLAAKSLPSFFPAGSGKHEFALLALLPVMIALGLLAPRLHFSLADIRRLRVTKTAASDDDA